MKKSGSVISLVSVVLLILPAMCGTVWAADSAAPALSASTTTVATTAVSASAVVPPTPEGPLAVVKIISLGGDGGWDYSTVDYVNRRLYLARDNRVMVVDLEKGTLAGEIPDTPGCHGIALVPERNEGYITSAGKKDNSTGSVIVFDTKTLKVRRTIPAGKKPDAILYDSASQKVFAFNHGDGTVTVIDPAAPAEAKPNKIEVGGTLEFGVTDGQGRIFVNVEDKNEVAVIDSQEGKVLAHWPIGEGREPTGLDIDAGHGRLFVACGNEKMIVMRTGSGQVMGTIVIGKGVDGCAFDPRLALALSADGKDGTVSVVHERHAGKKFNGVQVLATAKGARTITVDLQTHCFYLPCLLPGEAGQQTFGLLVVGVKDRPTAG